MRRIHIFISGRVQGVFFRYFTKKEAEKLNIKGFVKNLVDGRVEIIAEGNEKNIENLLEWCKKGSILANVKKIELIDEKFKNEFDIFEIRY